MKCFRISFLCSITAFTVSFALGGDTVALGGDTVDTKPIDGLRENVPSVYALTHAKITIEPGRVLEDAAMVVRDGAIVDIGNHVELPNDAKLIDLAGKSIYPGFIDAYGELSTVATTGGAKHWNSLVTPELEASQHYSPDGSLQEKLRSQGIVARLIAPANGIIKGRSLLVSTANESSGLGILKADVAQHLKLGIPRSRAKSGYPNSPMGAVALARQTFLDAQWYRQAWAAYQANGTLPRPERNDALSALAASLDANQRVIIDSANELYLLRAHDFAREFSLNAIFRGSGQEYQRLEAVRATGRSLIIPINFPKPPSVNSPELVRGVELDELLHWDLAPENPSRLAEAGVRFAFTSNGLNDPNEFLAQIKKAISRGLTTDAALRSLTVVPAEMFDVSDRLGTLALGKSASFVVVDGDLFAKATRVLETWVDGHRFEIAKPEPKDIRGEWNFTISKSDGSKQDVTVKVNGKPDKLTGTLSLPAKEGKAVEVKLESLSLRDQMFTGRLEGKSFDQPGNVLFSCVLDASAEENMTMTGTLVWPEGNSSLLKATRTSKPSTPRTPEKSDEAESGEESSKVDKDEASDSPKASAAQTSRKEETKDVGKVTFAPSIVNYPLGAFGRSATPTQPKHLAIKNATLWTCSSQGILKNASILITDGKIVSIGESIEIPSDAVTVDATGKHLSPGIIDCHSHMATDGGVNEGTQAITAEVRIGDFVDCNDVDIYRQLAGGVTTANVLHGSANPIGGQNQVIQLRWGDSYEAMKFSSAPAGIKFALGENVKRSNSTGEGSERYPHSRMGVDQLIRDAFHAAKEYKAKWDRWNQFHDTLPPRRDLELEALSEVLLGERWVHCHSYRQDEILALLRTCEEFGIKIATFQHILEGYKVADAMARHGAMGSSFSDWWAYKMEAYDAIPYNGALMHHSGVVVSFNSDDQELARHLNHEAAKAIKYGQLTPEEALKFVTLNPAKQLRIDRYVGSLEVGKQADFAVWSGPPLSLLSRCEQTWIDGRKYFDIQEDLAQREAAQSIRARLVQKILSSGQPTKKGTENTKPDESLWLREDIYCTARSSQ